MAVSPLPSRGPKRGRNHYVTPAFSGVTKAKHGEEIRTGCLILAFSGAQKRAELLRNTYILGGPQRQARGKNQKWPCHPCLLGVPNEGGIATQPLHSRGSPTPSTRRKSEPAASSLPSRGPKRGRNHYVTPAFSGSPTPSTGKKIRNGRVTLAFLGSQKRAESLRNPCILGGPQRQALGGNQNQLPHPCLFGGPKVGGILHNPCILGGPQRQARGTKSEVGASPLPARGP